MTTIYTCDVCDEEFYNGDECLDHEDGHKECNIEKMEEADETCDRCRYFLAFKKRAKLKNGRIVDFVNYDCRSGLDVAKYLFEEGCSDWKSNQELR